MDIKNDALISPNSKYRYWLTRFTHGGERPKRANSAIFVMLNPSTADAREDDPTIRRCRNFAGDWGYAGLIVLNLYAFRATDPADLFKADFPGPEGPANDYWLTSFGQDSDIICAWGNHAKAGRVAWFVEEMARIHARLWCLGTNQSGSPKHPLYLKGDTPLEEWKP